METNANETFLDAKSQKAVKKITNLLSKLPEPLSSAAYAVGGCVRDTILGIPAKDIDICSHFLPQEVLDICFAAGLPTYNTGIEHGTITIMFEGHGIEHTTFRKDVAPTGRRSDVTFSKSLEEDALRRDFTINALYLNKDGDVIDPSGDGLRTLLQMKKLKPGKPLLSTIGSCEDRFAEDYLRILRAARFLLKFDIAQSPEITQYLLDPNRQRDLFINLVKNISIERRVEELYKVLELPPTPVIFSEFFSLTKPHIFDKVVWFIPVVYFDVFGQGKTFFYNPDKHPKVEIFMENKIEAMLKDLYFSKVQNPKKIEFLTSFFLAYLFYYLENRGIETPTYERNFKGLDILIYNRAVLIKKLFRKARTALFQEEFSTIVLDELWGLKREFQNLLMRDPDIWILWKWLTTTYSLDVFGKHYEASLIEALAVHYDPKLLTGPLIGQFQCQTFQTTFKKIPHSWTLVQMDYKKI